MNLKTKSLYCREYLYKHKIEPIDVEELVTHYINLCSDSMAFWKKIPGDPESAYDILSGWSRMKRYHPDLLTPHQEQMTQLKAIIEEYPDILCRSAARLPNPIAWLRQVQHYRERYLSGDYPDYENEVYAIRGFLSDLDELELVIQSMSELGHPDPELEEQLQQCLLFTSRYPDFFLPAEVFIRTISATVRSDISDINPALALTAEKFILFLDELEAAHSELSLSSLNSFHLPELHLLVTLTNNLAMIVDHVNEVHPLPSEILGNLDRKTALIERLQSLLNSAVSDKAESCKESLVLAIRDILNKAKPERIKTKPDESTLAETRSLLELLAAYLIKFQH